MVQGCFLLNSIFIDIKCRTSSNRFFLCYDTLDAFMPPYPIDHLLINGFCSSAYYLWMKLIVSPFSSMAVSLAIFHENRNSSTERTKEGKKTVRCTIPVRVWHHLKKNWQIHTQHSHTSSLEIFMHSFDDDDDDDGESLDDLYFGSKYFSSFIVVVVFVVRSKLSLKMVFISSQFLLLLLLVV